MPDDSTQQSRPRGRQNCPHCEYALEGLPPGANRCPECGGSLSAAAFALADMRRARTSLAGRLTLLASPGVGIIAGFPLMLMRRGFIVPLSVLFVALWIGGAIALYLSATRERKSIIRSIGLGLPLGVVYFTACLAIALIIVLLIKLLMVIYDR